MSLSIFSQNCIKLLRVSPSNIISPFVVSCFHTGPVHCVAKHYIPKWKKLRREKVLKIDLPNLNEKVDEMSDEQKRRRMKQRGIKPARLYIERQFFLSSTSDFFEPYVPPEGDGKMSVVSKEGAKQKLQLLEKKSKSMMAIRKIKSYEDDFSTSAFIEKAQEIYMNAHTHLCNRDRLQLREYVTEKAYGEMRFNTHDKTMRWQFIKSLEPPRIAHARCTHLIEKENMFGQITVRFHTQQTLAVYDRFGRLMHGSEFIPKDVLEYIVFEKHLSNEYGVWKLHGKIIPDWLPPRTPAAKTYVMAEEEPEAPLDTVAQVAETNVKDQEVVAK